MNKKEVKTKQPTSEITFATPLNLVYRREDKMYILPELDISRKEELWGVELPGQICVELKRNSRKDIERADWQSVKAFAERTECNGRRGHLPSVWHFLSTEFEEKHRIERGWVESFNATVEILRANGVDAEKCGGIVWCEEKCSLMDMYVARLDICDESSVSRIAVSFLTRVAVAF